MELYTIKVKLFIGQNMSVHISKLCWLISDPLQSKFILLSSTPRKSSHDQSENNFTYIKTWYMEFEYLSEMIYVLISKFNNKISSATNVIAFLRPIFKIWSYKSVRAITLQQWLAGQCKYCLSKSIIKRNVVCLLE